MPQEDSIKPTPRDLYLLLDVVCSSFEEIRYNFNSLGTADRRSCKPDISFLHREVRSFLVLCTHGKDFFFHECEPAVATGCDGAFVVVIQTVFLCLQKPGSNAKGAGEESFSESLHRDQ